MKRNVLLNLCLILLAVNVFADGVTQDVDKVFSLEFPAAPRTGNMPGVRGFLYMTDSCSYMVRMTPMTKQDAIKDSASLSAFYGGTVKGIIRASSGTLLGSKPVDIQGIQGFELDYVQGGRGHLVAVTSRILLTQGHLIVYTFTTPFEHASAMQHLKKHFFESFSLDKEQLDHINATDTTTAKVQTATPIFDSVTAQTPKPKIELVNPSTLHFIISFAICILVLAGILYLIVRLKKRAATKK